MSLTNVKTSQGNTCSVAAKLTRGVLYHNTLLSFKFWKFIKSGCLHVTCKQYKCSCCAESVTSKVTSAKTLQGKVNSWRLQKAGEKGWLSPTVSHSEAMSPPETCSPFLPVNHQTSFPLCSPRFYRVVFSHMKILDVAYSTGEKKKEKCLWLKNMIVRYL